MGYEGRWVGRGGRVRDWFEERSTVRSLLADVGALTRRALSSGPLEGSDGISLVYPAPEDDPLGCVAFVAWRDAHGRISAREAGYSPFGPHVPQIARILSGSAEGASEVGYTRMCVTLATVAGHAGDPMALWMLRSEMRSLCAGRGTGSGTWQEDVVEDAIRGAATANATVARAFLASLPTEALESAVWLQRRDPEEVGVSRLVSGSRRHWDGQVDLGRVLDVAPAYPYALSRAWVSRRAGYEAPMPSGRSAATEADLTPSGRSQEVVRPLARMRAVLGAGMASYAARWGDDVADDFFTVPTCGSDPDASGVEDQVVRIARLVGRLPPDWLPGDEAGWEALSLCKPVLEFGEALQVGDHVARWVNSGGDWAKYSSRLTKACGAVGIARAVSDVADMTKAFQRQIVGPALWSPDPQPTVWNDTLRAVSTRVLASDRSAVRVLETSREWHSRMHVIDAVERALPRPDQGSTLGHDRWDAGFPDWSCDGLEFVVLTNVGELVSEGGRGPDADGMDGLSHCVSTYAVDCASNSCRIMSIRERSEDGRARRLSTVELVRWGAKTEVRQHRGHGNSAPPDIATSALASYLGLIRSGKLPVDEAALRYRDLGRSRFRQYDPSVPGSWETLRDAWAPMLPGPVRVMDRATFGDAVRASLAGDETVGWLPRSFGS